MHTIQCHTISHYEGSEWRDRFVAELPEEDAPQDAVNHWMLWLFSADDSPLARWQESAWMKRIAALYCRRLASDEPTEQEWEASGNAAWAVVRDLEGPDDVHPALRPDLDPTQEADVLAAKATAWAATAQDAHWAAVSAARASLLARMEDERDPAVRYLRIARPLTDWAAWRRMLDRLLVETSY